MEITLHLARQQRHQIHQDGRREQPVMIISAAVGGRRSLSTLPTLPAAVLTSIAPVQANSLSRSLSVRSTASSLAKAQIYTRGTCTGQVISFLALAAPWSMLVQPDHSTRCSLLCTGCGRSIRQILKLPASQPSRRPCPPSWYIHPGFSVNSLYCGPRGLPISSQESDIPLWDDG